MDTLYSSFSFLFFEMLLNFKHISSFSLILLLIVFSIKSSCYKRSTCVCTLCDSNNCPCETGRLLIRRCWWELNEASKQIIYIEDFFVRELLDESFQPWWKWLTNSTNVGLWGHFGWFLLWDRPLKSCSAFKLWNWGFSRLKAYHDEENALGAMFDLLIIHI